MGFVWDATSLNSFSTAYLRTHSDHVTSWRDRYSGAEHILSTGFNTVNAPDPSGVSYHMTVEVDYINQIMTLSLDSATATFTGSDFFLSIPSRQRGGGLLTAGERVSYDNVVVKDFTVNSVPEPATLALLGLGLAGIRFRRS